MPSHEFQDPRIIRNILRMRRIAMVGLSGNTIRPSYFVGYYLKRMGFEVIPVNPRYEEILGLRCHPSLSAIPQPPEVVDVFRKPEEIPEVVDEAIAVGAKALWLQFGVINEPEARRAREAGLSVVMDRCMKIEHGRWRGSLQWAGIRTGVITSRKEPLI
ncbi:MAG: CoA-binding protein [Candidatus Tectomicrobia bacterium]|uniref:CoA-binding protein n=1 Tax=Tectimicrobiota bacterium TaxID=2528274 RepID=A0A932I127_UNCTE|nr:CoA-binding protein [Candidatus Tectomicrobia bacterium]